MSTEALEPGGLYRLLAWLSPSFPVGAFSYSHGLEWLVETGVVRDEVALAAWVRDVLAVGSGFSDAILFAAAYRAARSGDIDELADIAELSAAFCPGAERHLETTAQGRAFAEAVAGWDVPTLGALTEIYDSALGYPVAVAIAVADHGIPLDTGLHAYLHAFAANLISAGLRLIPLGQTSGQRVTLAIEQAIKDCAARASVGSLDDMGSGLLLTDLASLQHETQYTRLFRS